MNKLRNKIKAFLALTLLSFCVGNMRADLIGDVYMSTVRPLERQFSSIRSNFSARTLGDLRDLLAQTDNAISQFRDAVGQSQDRSSLKTIRKLENNMRALVEYISSTEVTETGQPLPLVQEEAPSPMPETNIELFSPDGESVIIRNNGGALVIIRNDRIDEVEPQPEQELEPEIQEEAPAPMPVTPIQAPSPTPVETVELPEEETRTQAQQEEVVECGICYGDFDEDGNPLEMRHPSCCGGKQSICKDCLRTLAGNRTYVLRSFFSSDHAIFRSRELAVYSYRTSGSVLHLSYDIRYEQEGDEWVVVRYNKPENLRFQRIPCPFCRTVGSDAPILEDARWALS
jgi:hypothetical protein